MSSKLLSKAAAPGPDGCIQRITPAGAGWDYVGFEVYLLQNGMQLSGNSGDWEICFVLVAGKADVAAGGENFSGIGQRKSPFERTPPYSVYVPPQTDYRLIAVGDAEGAVCQAPGKGEYPVRLIAPADIEPVRRGKGFNQRYVHNILDDNAPAESLLVVEVFTDEGNTSSYPSHKHDTDNPPEETYLVETYYHRFDPPQGWAMQRVYVDDRSLDECMPVYDKDVVMVPKGYHPIATIAGYDNYYLNVMAGPLKMWRFTWEKDHAWINSDAYPRRK